MTVVAFWALAGLSILSALLCITRHSPVSAALWLVATLFGVAGMFLVLDAQFLAAIQIIVYAGAIMVLFLFVIMLLNLGRGGPSDLRGWPGRILAGVIALGLGGELWALRGLFQTAAYRLPEGTMAQANAEMGVVDLVAETLFREYLVPFEITSVLLLAAAVGAVVLAKRKV